MHSNVLVSLHREPKTKWKHVKDIKELAKKIKNKIIISQYFLCLNLYKFKFQIAFTSFTIFAIKNIENKGFENNKY